MYKVKRMGLGLTLLDKAARVAMIKAESGLVPRFRCDAARERGIWLPNRLRCAIQQNQEVQRG